MEKRTKFSLGYFLAIFLLGWALDSMIFSGSADKEIPYSEFRQRLANNKIESVVIAPDKLYGLMKMPDSTKNTTPDSTKQATSDSARKASLDSSKRATLNLAQQADSTNSDHSFTPHSPHTPWALKLVGAEDGHKRQFTVIPLPDDKLLADLQAHGVEYRGKNATDWLSSLFFNMKYTRLGAKLPKGVLLVGPPGSGKTLLARAVAGEAAVPFFSLSGSDFVEMFVGVGAARVRDLFAQAKTKAPCIIFIDEIDTIGKSRGQGVITAGYDERENTLNQLLVEMDGFDASIGIIMMGATNRPDVLDPALLRPGRFDRQILVDRPDLNGRMEIFKVHTRWLLLNNKVDLRKLAAQTPGFAGAEIANVCNEAALLASRRGRDQITMADFQDAIERVIAGLEKKNKLINVLERKIVAYHESGHAIVGHFTPGVDPVQKVSIVLRGIGALGYTLQTPLEDRYLMSRSELIGKIKGLLGGRAAEEVVFGEISTGASNDLERATKIARDMFVVYGMSTRVPNISLVEREQNRLLGQGPMMSRRSEKIEQIVDEEVLEMINSCYETDKVLLQEKRKQLEKMAQTLLEKETIDEKDILAILGPRPKI